MTFMLGKIVNERKSLVILLMTMLRLDLGTYLDVFSICETQVTRLSKKRNVFKVHNVLIAKHIELDLKIVNHIIRDLHSQYRN